MKRLTQNFSQRINPSISQTKKNFSMIEEQKNQNYINQMEFLVNEASKKLNNQSDERKIFGIIHEIKSNKQCNPNDYFEISADGQSILNDFFEKGFFETQIKRNNFIQIHFKRYKIYPFAFVIQMDKVKKINHYLKTFSFYGGDGNDKWELLDEHVNEYQLACSSKVGLFFFFTQKCYSDFKLEQTGPSQFGEWKFSISAFDIHGFIEGENN